MSRAHHAAEHGFTLLEVLVVVAIVGIFVTLALPSYQSSIRDSSREEAAMAFVNALALARSEAVARGQQIMVAPNAVTDDPAGTGLYAGGVWSVMTQNLTPAFPGDPSPVIEVYQVSAMDRVSLGAAPANISTNFIFNPDGTLNQTGAIVFCHNADTQCKQVRVSLVGSAQLAKVPKP